MPSDKTTLTISECKTTIAPTTTAQGAKFKFLLIDKAVRSMDFCVRDSKGGKVEESSPEAGEEL